MGVLLVASQVWIASKSDILSSMFEVIMAAIASFISAAVASTGLFCYAALVSSSIVLILPGWLVCCAALELQARSIVVGSVRIVWVSLTCYPSMSKFRLLTRTSQAIFFSLLLGFGISIGAQFWHLFTGQTVLNPSDNTCLYSHYPGPGQTPVPWYRQTIPLWFAFLVRRVLCGGIFAD